MQAGIADTMCNTMINKGLTKGSVGREDAVRILNTMVVPTVVYGLSRTDMGRADRRRLRDVLARAGLGGERGCRMDIPRSRSR